VTGSDASGVKEVFDASACKQRPWDLQWNDRDGVGWDRIVMDRIGECLKSATGKSIYVREMGLTVRLDDGSGLRTRQKDRKIQSREKRKNCRIDKNETEAGFV
jgi:hypothetical protein